MILHSSPSLLIATGASPLNGSGIRHKRLTWADGWQVTISLLNRAISVVRVRSYGGRRV